MCNPIISPRAPDNSMYTNDEIYTTIGKGIIFHKQNFKLDEVEDLCDILEKRFGYIVWPNKNKHIVAISGKCYDQITSDIYPYIIRSMQYKWPKPRKS